MFLRNRLMIVRGVLLCAGLSFGATPLWADLDEYIRKPEPAFAWKQNGKTPDHSAGDQIYDLHFVSQTWQGQNWQHQLQVYRPQSVAPAAMMFLWVTGGSATAGQIAFGMELARKSKAPVAVLYHIPNQPLLEDQLVEDDLIAETFVRYLKTKDENWPLLFPMVKSVVKAMSCRRSAKTNGASRRASSLSPEHPSVAGRLGLPLRSISESAPLLPWSSTRLTCGRKCHGS